MKDENNKLEFRGGMFMSLVPVAIFFAFCIILFVVFKAFNMEALAMGGFVALCALPGFVDSKNEEKTERNAGYLVVSHSGGGMLRQGTRKGIRRTPANRGMRAHWVVKGLDISEDVCHGMCP